VHSLLSCGSSHRRRLQPSNAIFTATACLTCLQILQTYFESEKLDSAIFGGGVCHHASVNFLRPPPASARISALEPALLRQLLLGRGKVNYLHERIFDVTVLM
jgi:hypothetical protein